MATPNETHRLPPYQRWIHVPRGNFMIRGIDLDIYVFPIPPNSEKHPRGEWVARIDRGGDEDAFDWPRYYFDLDRAFLECEAWLKRRKQWIPE